LAGGLKVAEAVHGLEEISLGAVEAPLEAGEVAAEDVAAVVVCAFGGALGDALPEAGLDVGEAAELPLAADDDVYEGAFFGCGGTVVIVVLGGEGFEFGAVFGGDDFKLGVYAGLEGVESGGGFAFGGAGSGGLLGVGAIGCDLLRRCHASPVARGKWGIWVGAAKWLSGLGREKKCW
jgi:hypothetical protein